jgi:hypothetical protein
MAIFTQDVLAHFQELLRERLAGASRLAEDSVRYSLHESLQQKGGVAGSEILVPYDHPVIERAKIDSYLPASQHHGAAAWELKYDRAIPSGKNQPRSEKAGALLNDFFRLAAFPRPPDLERVVIYLTDSEMVSYLRNPRNGLGGLFDLASTRSFTLDRRLLDSRAASVRKKIKAPVTTCWAVGRFAVSLAREHELRVYDVSLNPCTQLQGNPAS